LTFLPNKFMRYSAALRNYIQYSILKNGIEHKHYTQLKRIIISEIIFSDCNNTICDLEKTLIGLLFAVKLIKTASNYDFKYKIDVAESCIINFKALTVLILSICKFTDEIIIYTFNGRIIIKATGKAEKHSHILTKKLNGCVFYELKTDKTYVALPYNATDKKSELADYKSTQDYISNPLSLVNIFIN